MAPNPRNNIHDDPYMSDTYCLPGPFEDGPEISTLFSRECASVTFDSAGRIVTICVALDRPVRSGHTVYRRLVGTGFDFNNNYAPVTLGPDGTAYVGSWAGWSSFLNPASPSDRDGVWPPHISRSGLRPSLRGGAAFAIT